jgi:hypothetical protein
LQGQQNNIIMVIDDLDISVNCSRCSNEKISARDWFAFVNNANLQAGSRLRFTLADPPQVLNVIVINPNV